MQKVLLVCLGNICRSPLAHGVLEHLVDSNKVVVDSAGTGAYHVGKAPDRRSIAIAKANGLDISQQRARQFKAQDFQLFDHIFAMDKENLADVRRLAPDAETAKKAKLFLSVLKNSVEEVPDPYYGGEEGFQYVYDLVLAASQVIVKKLETA
ncbi:low molecular weight protein-tyrosine-phosphatase [Aureicoccus marinus]|jgi:protein-tyrosine phosphatase|uniref:protein-tyrosine-phosphatase n=1 Tax=Aureicoccus marinus TaxID=754435 RepID=A0A2S7T4I6_9FLAO|nr:low molecular weight protein-tyrosine-phosphatase [Aureicoccus marinus]PQJ14852.1 protein-tyrosine-phosphatase [Aureicoccus marinus]